jgi:alpha-glucosidase
MQINYLSQKLKGTSVKRLNSGRTSSIDTTRDLAQIRPVKMRFHSPDFNCRQNLWRLLILGLILFGAINHAHAQTTNKPAIIQIHPPEKSFFSKQLDFHGIPIKAHHDVSDSALDAAYNRLSLLFTNLLIKQPSALSNLVAAGAELLIIGRHQSTTDLPEWQQDKGKPLAEYNGLTRDQRTRGMGGLLTSCGEENLLKLDDDRYRGRDICLHEFAHSLRNHGIPREVRQRFNRQHQLSLQKGLWKNSYAGSNPDEFFAELTMWYFGSHGDLNMTGPKPANGPEGLKAYDPEAFALFDDFYQGRIEINLISRR